MNREYDVFELLPDGAPVWRDHVHGLQNAHQRLAEISKTTKNECFVIHIPTKEIVARVNLMAGGETTDGEDLEK